MRNFIQNFIGRRYYGAAYNLMWAIRDLPIGKDIDIYSYWKKYLFWEKILVWAEMKVPYIHSMMFLPDPIYNKENAQRWIAHNLIKSPSEITILLPKPSDILYEQYFKDDFKSYYDNFQKNYVKIK